MAKEKLNILLIQIRENEEVKKEELESFAKYAGLKPSQFTIYDVFKRPEFTGEIAKGFDGVFIGGASEASVLEPETYTFMPSLIKFIQDTIEMEIPVFASCFGFQAAVLALGGKITRDTDNYEMGTYPMLLTEKAKEDLIFKSSPDGFHAVSVHQEKATELPESCELLAYTKECCHSFKVKGKPFWAFQFHPELDRPCLKHRLGIYAEKYTENRKQFEKVIASLQETNEANLLVTKFVDLVLV